MLWTERVEALKVRIPFNPALLRARRRRTDKVGLLDFDLVADFDIFTFFSLKPSCWASSGRTYS